MKKANNKKKTPKKTMLSDKIIPLIKDKQKDFLVGGKLDADQITSYLKSNEREFSRHKNTPLKIAVGQAIARLQGSSKSQDQDSSDSEDISLEYTEDESDVELMEVKNTNMMNDLMTRHYQGNVQKNGNNNGQVQPETQTETQNQNQNQNLNQNPTLPQVQPFPQNQSLPQNQPQTENQKQIDQRNGVQQLANTPQRKLSNNLDKGLKRKKSIDQNEEASKKLKGDKLSRRDSEKDKGNSFVTRPTLRYADLGGIESILQDIRELIEYPLCHPEIFVHLGVEPLRGILLHGPPGCGKTMLANAIAGELGVPFLKISAPEIVSGMSGESEAKIRDLFNEAKKNAPCLIFIDEIDAITPKRDTAQREMEKRIVAQFLISMGDVSMEHTGNKPVIIIGATNRPDSLDIALRRAGRFDREISLGIPDQNARERILKVMARKLRLSGDFDFKTIAKETPGYVGADLEAITKEAAVIAINRIFKQLDPDSETKDELKDRSAVSEKLRSHERLTDEQLSHCYITMGDFEEAIKKVQPSSKREGFATVPNVTWDDIGALEAVRTELEMAIVQPIKNPEMFEGMGIHSPCGVLLWGPPGCGKTMLAKAISNQSSANFISVKGPELLNKFVGESERAVRQVFQRARTSSPCVIFFDELDALCPKRSEDSNSQASERVVNQLLTEMDGLDGRKQVYVIGATNRPDIIDPAMLRPGRLDKLVYVNLPTPEERYLILKTQSGKMPLDESVNLHTIANSEKCNGFSGADLAALLRESAVAALYEAIFEKNSKKESTPTPKESPSILGNLSSASTEKIQVPIVKEEVKVEPTPPSPKITMAHFDLAFQKVFPSVSAQDQRSYQMLQKKLHGRRRIITSNQTDELKDSSQEKIQEDSNKMEVNGN